MWRLRYLAESINFGAAVPLSFVLSGYLISGILCDTIGTPKRWRRFYSVPEPFWSLAVEAGYLSFTYRSRRSLEKLSELAWLVSSLPLAPVL
jgi:peptidoglycan/LPS O-acetylase OafA/YrhL